MRENPGLINRPVGWVMHKLHKHHFSHTYSTHNCTQDCIHSIIRYTVIRILCDS